MSPLTQTRSKTSKVSVTKIRSKIMIRIRFSSSKVSVIYFTKTVNWKTMNWKTKVRVQLRYARLLIIGRFESIQYQGKIIEHGPNFLQPIGRKIDKDAQ